eukprot:snap_masked-scaffold_12-processed-gene-8.44-mRNA-1 protein AED:0.06 eAED:0.06 QI:0/-1/0/1/-1/1/1/0/270
MKRRNIAGAFSIFISTISILYSLSHFIISVNSLSELRNPFGLICGLSGVAFAQAVVLFYQHQRRIKNKNISIKKTIQLKKIPYLKGFWEDSLSHLQRPELFLLVPYLCITWLFDLMPEKYYNIEESWSFIDVIKQLLVVDFFTFCFHLAEHEIPTIYKKTHKAHHKFTNPHLFNAFDATILDAVFLILFPLYLTMRFLPVSCASYIVFGMTYSSHFMLIHSEFEHSFDPLLKLFYVNTAADHHVHHKLFKYNYGHFFTIYDQMAGTYKTL